jgi:hypothetical protein
VDVVSISLRVAAWFLFSSSSIPQVFLLRYVSPHLRFRTASNSFFLRIYIPFCILFNLILNSHHFLFICVVGGGLRGCFGCVASAVEASKHYVALHPSTFLERFWIFSSSRTYIRMFEPLSSHSPIFLLKFRVVVASLRLVLVLSCGLKSCNSHPLNLHFSTIC